MEGSAGPTRAPAVKVRLPSPAFGVVALVGEHDLHTRPQLEDALAAVAGTRPNVLVDLAACEFMDSSVLHALAAARAEVAARGGKLAVVIPPAAQTMHRAAELLQLDLELRIFPTQTAAFRTLAGA